MTEEVEAALAARRAEPGEVVVANLRADTIGAAMARASVVDGDPVGRFQAGTQHLAGLRQKVVLSVDQQAHELTLGDADPNSLKLRDQALDRHLTLAAIGDGSHANSIQVEAPGQSVTLACRIDVSGDRLSIDFSSTSPQLGRLQPVLELEARRPQHATVGAVEA